MCVYAWPTILFFYVYLWTSNITGISLCHEIYGFQLSFFSSVYLHILITLFMGTDGWLCLCKVYIHLASLSLSLSLLRAPSLLCLSLHIERDVVMANRERRGRMNTQDQMDLSVCLWGLVF